MRFSAFTYVVLIWMVASSATHAADQIDFATLDKQISETLRDVHNRGAELHNVGDQIGCYRMYQGGLIALKPLLGHRPDVQKTIDLGSRAADLKPLHERAFALHTTMAEVRRQLRPADASTPNQTPTELPTPKTTTSPLPPPVSAPPPSNPTPLTPAPLPAPGSITSFNDVSKPLPASIVPTPFNVSLWDRLGGHPKIEKVVDDAINLCLVDPKVNLSRDGKYKLDEETVAGFKRKCVGFISSLTEGSVPYTGLSLKEIHQGMNIKPEEWSAMVWHLRKSLEGHSVTEPDEHALMKKLDEARSEVVVEVKK